MIKYSCQSAPVALTFWYSVEVQLCSVYSGMVDFLSVYLFNISTWSDLGLILAFNSTSDQPRLLVGCLII